MTQRRRWLARTAPEFALIVVGVLAALALEAWWVGVQDRRAEAEYILDLLDESSRNAEALGGLISSTGSIEGDLYRALAILESGHVSDSAEALIVSLGRGGQFYTLPRLTRAVFDDLSNSGRLQLIRDARLRRGVLDHYGRQEAAFGRLIGVQQEVGSSLASLVASVLPPGLVTRNSDAAATGWTIAADASRVSLTRTADALVSNARLVPSIRQELAVLQRERYILMQSQADIGRHAALLKEFVR